MRSERVLVTPPMLQALPAAFAPLASHGFDIVFNTGPYPLDEHALTERMGDAVAVIAGLDRVTDYVFSTCPRLRIVARNGVGFDNVDLEAASRRGVFVTVPWGANSISVAELTIGLMIDL